MLQRLAVVALLALAPPWGAPLSAQQPVPPPPPPFPSQPFPPPAPVPVPAGGPAAAPGSYRAPSLALVQPAGGGVVPQDRPVVVFRFVQGEAGDPIDARSFAVTVDGQDRTSLFQVSIASAEAWGPLAAFSAPALQTDPAVLAQSLAVGAHEVAARVCSVRGVCAAVTAIVVAVPQGGTADSSPSLGAARAGAASSSAASATVAAACSSPGRKIRVLKRVLDAVRVLMP